MEPHKHEIPCLLTHQIMTLLIEFWNKVDRTVPSARECVVLDPNASTRQRLTQNP